MEDTMNIPSFLHQFPWLCGCLLTSGQVRYIATIEEHNYSSALNWKCRPLWWNLKRNEYIYEACVIVQMDSVAASRQLKKKLFFFLTRRVVAMMNKSATDAKSISKTWSLLIIVLATSISLAMEYDMMRYVAIFLYFISVYDFIFWYFIVRHSRNGARLEIIARICGRFCLIMAVLMGAVKVVSVGCNCRVSWRSALGQYCQRFNGSGFLSLKIKFFYLEIRVVCYIRTEYNSAVSIGLIKRFYFSRYCVN